MSRCQPIPAAHDHLIPHLVCDPCADAIEFYKQAFGAEEVNRIVEPGGKRIMHAAIKIGSDHVFLNDDFPEMCGGKSMSPKALQGTPVTIHRYVADCDSAVRQAEKAGATVTMQPTDMFWGDRYSIVTDPFGHQWSIATHVKDLTTEEIQAGMEAAFASQGSPQ